MSPADVSVPEPRRARRRHRAPPSAHRPLRADDARRGARRRHGCSAAACSRCSPAGCRTGAATASSPARTGCWTRSSTSGSADAELDRLADGRRPGDPRLARGLPLHRRRRRLPGGRAVLPRLAGAHGQRHVRRGRAARDPGPVDPQPRLRDRVGRGPDGRPRPPAGRSSRWARGARTSRPRWRRPAPPTSPGFAATSNLEAGRRYGVPTAGTAAHAFTLLHDDELAAFRSQVGCLGTKHDAAGGHLRHPPRHRDRAIEAAGPGLDAIRIDSGDLGELARQARDAARRARGHRDAHRALRRPRRVRDRRAARRAGRLVRRGHVGGHRLGRADRGNGLQARRGGRPAGRPSAARTRSPAAGTSPRCAASSRPGPRWRRSCTP